MRGVFDSVAGKYDLMNDLMSVGLHRLWKRFAVNATGVRAGMRVLDLAGGTGDLALLFAERVGAGGEVVLTDINGAMLGAGATGWSTPAGWCRRSSATPRSCRSRAGISTASASPSGCATSRARKQALAEMARVLKPGGVAAVLEFSRVYAPLAPAYDWYSFNVLPRLGKLVAGDDASYRYLAESIRMHPDQATLKAHDGTSRLRPGRSPQSDGRGCRRCISAIDTDGRAACPAAGTLQGGMHEKLGIMMVVALATVAFTLSDLADARRLGGGGELRRAARRASPRGRRPPPPAPRRSR